MTKYNKWFSDCYPSGREYCDRNCGTERSHKSGQSALKVSKKL